MVLVGDAACFVDPVFSSGVHLATFSGLLAARSINTVLAGKLDERRSFAEFEARYRAECAVFYEFLVSFYQMHVSEDSYFWQARKVTSANSGDLQAFVDLIGGVSSGDSALMNVAAVGERFRTASAELSAAVDQVAESRSGTMKPLFDSRIVGDVMAEGARIQATAFLGTADDRPAATGTGLIATDDGLLWTESGDV
ncbi:tryptophan 7-halogenase [Streptomyces sp. NPDC057430]